MSEEENNEVSDLVTEEAVPAEVDKGVESDNPIFNALFKAVENEPEEEPISYAPKSLSSTLHEIENEFEEPAQEPQAEVAEQPVVEAPKRKSVKRKRKVVDPNPSVAPAPSYVPEAPEQEDLSGLTPEEQERYSLAKWASANDSTQKGKDKDYLKFFSAHKAYIDERLSQDPDVELAEDPEYRNFINQNKVNFDAPSVLRRKLKHEAKAEALEEIKPEQDKIRRQINRLEREPVAKKAIADKKQLIAKSIPEDIVNSFKEDKDWANNNTLEAGIVDRVLGDAYSLIDAFYNIANDLESFDANNSVHARLSKWIDDEQTAFVNSGKTRRNGKVFIRRERANSLSEAEKNKYYTFSDDDLMNILSKRAKSSMESQIKSTISSIEKAGFTRVNKQAARVEQTIQTPRAPTPTPRPNSSTSTKSPKQENKVLELLGML